MYKIKITPTIGYVYTYVFIYRSQLLVKRNSLQYRLSLCLSV